MKKKYLKNTNTIFSKKLNNKHKIIPLKETILVLGANRYFPSATREWYNSVYAFNKNTLKNFSVLDKNLKNFFKSYFNLRPTNTLLNNSFLEIEEKEFDRLSFNKIFFSKPDLKHTCSKIIITLHVYNEEQRFLNFKLKNILNSLYSKPLKKNIKNMPFFISNINSNYKFFKQKNISFNLYLDNLYDSIIKRIDTGNIFYPGETENYKEYNQLIKDISFFCSINTNKNFEITKNIYEYINFYSFYAKTLRDFSYYKFLLNVNKSKFEQDLLANLFNLLINMYNKEIEFNIVNLKTMNLNSDIFTEAVSMKLKNRKNNLLKVLSSSLSMVKISESFRIKENYKKIIYRNLLINKVNNNYNKLIINKGNDFKLNKLLVKLFSNTKNTSNILNKNLEKTIFNIIRYKRIYGARLEAKGRLTKRFTASRSLFKFKWKGSLKNIDASYRGWSSIILRGNLKTHLQYSSINSKTRNGAFGLKGWISSR